MTRPLSRRTLLRGTGTALALPLLEAMMPRKAWAQAAKPLRLIAWYFPNGYYRATVNGALRDDWTPAQTGTGYTMSPILQPLAMFQPDLQIVSGVSNPPADTAPLSCAHARGTGSFLTCVAPQGDASDGVSMDQVAAGALGHLTKFPSLELGTNNAGGDTPIRSTIAWADGATPLSHESRAEALFDRLFAVDPVSPQEAAKRKLYSKSVLDSVLGSATSLRTRLGSGDQKKLDGYLNGIRELELRLDAPAVMCTPGARPAPTGDIQTQTKNLLDVLALAFQCDLTRVATFMFDRAGSDLSYPFLMANGAPIDSGHHSLSHHHSDPANLDQLQQILTWQVTQVAYLLGKLKAIDEGGESVLYRSAIFVSSEIGDGDLHEQAHFPIIVAGSAGGALKAGQHVAFTNPATKSDLFITLLQAVGVNVSAFGADGNTALPGLT